MNKQHRQEQEFLESLQDQALENKRGKRGGNIIQQQVTDDIHFADEDNESIDLERKGYKAEKSILTRSHHAKVNALKRALELNLKNELDGEKKEALVAKFNKDIDDLKQEYENENRALKEKYKYELAYHINPKLKRKPELIESNVLLSVRNLKQFFFFGSKLKNQKLKAVSNISFDVYKGENFGIVGESGCGKTTTGRTIIRLYKPTSGSIYYRGFRIGAGSRWNEKEIKWSKIKGKKKIDEINKELMANIQAIDPADPDKEAKINDLRAEASEKCAEINKHIAEVIKVQKQKIKQIKFDESHAPRKLLNEIQMIFQDPVDSLDPRMTVEDIIQEGLIIQGHKNRKENRAKVVEMLNKVGLVEEHASRYPHEFSGGQRQRIGIARALIMRPKLLICDEPISALDVSIRAQVINLLNDLKDELGLTVIFIAHDLSVVKYFCDRIAVMYFGKLVELATSEELFKHPLHPYTVSLLSAIPKPNPLTERERTRIIYKPNEVHNYETDKPTLREVCPGHVVYCNNEEFERYQAQIKEIDAKNAQGEVKEEKPAKKAPAKKAKKAE